MNPPTADHEDGNQLVSDAACGAGLSGFRNDEKVGLNVAIEDHLPGFRTFYPHIVRGVFLGAQDIANLGSNEILDPVHAFTPNVTRLPAVRPTAHRRQVHQQDQARH